MYFNVKLDRFTEFIETTVIGCQRLLNTVTDFIDFVLALACVA